jgi:hypothetical protein
MCRGDGEDVCFGFVKKNAKWGAKALKGFDEGWEVLVGQKREGVVEVGICRTLRATAVVTQLLIHATGIGSQPEHRVKRLKDLVYDEASEGWREWVALRKAVFLYEEIQGAVWSVENALIGLFVHEVKVMYEGVEAWLCFECFEGGFT